MNFERKKLFYNLKEINQIELDYNNFDIKLNQKSAFIEILKKIKQEINNSDILNLLNKDENLQENQFIDVLINLKMWQYEIPYIKGYIDEQINQMIKETINKKKSGFLFQICKILKNITQHKDILSEDDDQYDFKLIIIQNILQDYKQFSNAKNQIFIERIKEIGFEKSLEQMKIYDQKSKEIQKFIDLTKKEDQSKQRIFLKCYKEFEVIYLENFMKFDEKEEIINKIMELSNVLKNYKIPKQQQFNWNKQIRTEMIPQLLGYVFSLWTISLCSTNFKNLKEDCAILKPHSIQILTIFKLLNLDFDDNPDRWSDKFSKKKPSTLKNQMMQIRTGEGKSITLGILSIILALLGFDVHCICYSEYLSKRDYNDFKKLFTDLQIDQSINYSTFGNLCEQLINDKGDIRNLINNIFKNQLQIIHQKSHSQQKWKILLIDEVDVFFSKNFYGNLYNPGQSIQFDEFADLFKFIWKNREKQLNLNELNNTKEYQSIFENLSFLNKFKDIIDYQIQQMIDSRNQYNNPQYVVGQYWGQNKIGYKYLDQISYFRHYKYQTNFAYINEYEKGNMLQEVMDDNLGLDLIPFSFSYAEIPFQFDLILGVSGTLQYLSTIEKDIIQNDYEIKQLLYCPSIFGENNLKFRIEDDVYLLENKVQFFQKINQLIDINQHPSILVFFENEEILNEFHSEIFKNDPTKHKITEKMPIDERDHYIKKSTTYGQITFITRIFGRGIDFICRDHKVLKEGGVLVIQTFLSKEFSEEIQIKGRTARQGQAGIFKLVLNLEDLTKQGEFNFNKSKLEEFYNKQGLYNYLNEKRYKVSDKKKENWRYTVQNNKNIHQCSQILKDCVCNYQNNHDEEKIIYALKQVYKGKSLFFNCILAKGYF